MGFSVHYESLTELTEEQADAVRSAAHKTIDGYTWLSCEPVLFYPPEGTHLAGSSKPNFTPHPDDVASARLENLPDGTLMTAIEILCDLSRRFGIEWELSHDYSDGPIGTIVNGECDPEVLTQCEALAELTETLGGEMDFGGFDDDGPQLGIWQEPDEE
jgi:hypothetical protein